MAPRNYHDAPEVVPGHDSLQVSYGEGLETAQPGKEVVAPSGVVEYYAKDYEGKQIAIAGAPKARICGLSRRAFWIVLGVGILVIIAAVGGGVGGALAGNKSTTTTGTGVVSTPSTSASPQSTSASSSVVSSSSSSSTTIPQTTTTITTSIAIATDMAGCPLVNTTIFSAPSGSQFKKICYYDILATNIDIHMVQVSTLDSCIGLCDSYNTEHGAGSCKSVVWDLIGGDYQDCWMKNATDVLTKNGVVGKANGTVAAILQ